MNQILSEIILELVRWNWIDRIGLMLSALNLFILFLTYKWVKRYTIEAQVQSTEAIRQRLLSSMPSLQTRLVGTSVRPEKEGNQFITMKLLFTNIGNGTANNIILESIMFEEQKDMSLWPPQPDLSGSLFPKGHEEQVYCYYLYSGNREIPLGKEQTQRYWENENIVITIWFQDIMGQPYRQENKISKGRYFQGPPIVQMPTTKQKKSE